MRVFSLVVVTGRDQHLNETPRVEILADLMVSYCYWTSVVQESVSVNGHGFGFAIPRGSLWNASINSPSVFGVSHCLFAVQTYFGLGCGLNQAIPFCNLPTQVCSTVKHFGILLK